MLIIDLTSLKFFFDNWAGTVKTVLEILTAMGTVVAIFAIWISQRNIKRERKLMLLREEYHKLREVAADFTSAIQLYRNELNSQILNLEKVSGIEEITLRSYWEELIRLNRSFRVEVRGKVLIYFDELFRDVQEYYEIRKNFELNYKKFLEGLSQSREVWEQIPQIKLENDKVTSKEKDLDKKIWGILQNFRGRVLN